MTTRDSIIQLADHLTRDQGFNAFSFYDISRTIGIKTASIHYHFPTKTDLGVAVIKQHREKLARYIKKNEGKDPREKLDAFFAIYDKVKSENKVCIVGSLATDLHSVDEAIGAELKLISVSILDWVTEILKEGKAGKEFFFSVPPRTKALMIITNMLAIVQLARLTGDADFLTIKEAIIKELKK